MLKRTGDFAHTTPDMARAASSPEALAGVWEGDEGSMRTLLFLCPDGTFGATHSENTTPSAQICGQWRTAALMIVLRWNDGGLWTGLIKPFAGKIMMLGIGEAHQQTDVTFNLRATNH